MEHCFSGKISTLVKNRQAVNAVLHIESLIGAAVPFSKSLTSLEDSLLRLGNGHAEGLFYAMLLRFQSSMSSPVIYQLRYFEMGTFEGCFDKNRDVLFSRSENIDCGQSTIIPWRVYTDMDIHVAESSKSKSKGKLALVHISQFT